MTKINEVCFGKSDPVRNSRSGSPRCFVSKLVVDFLVEDEHVSVHVVDPDEIRPLGIVLDETGYAVRPLVPPQMRRGLTLVDLDHGSGQRLAPRPWMKEKRAFISVHFKLKLKTIKIVFVIHWPACNMLTRF